MAVLTDLSASRLTPEARSALAHLGALEATAGFYLAGSAALTLYLGHRRVRDVDLMSSTARLTSPERRDLLAAFLERDPRARVETARDGYLFLRSGEGSAVRLFHYPYPLLEVTPELDGLRVASALDLALMKLGAVISRALPRDFVDLYLLTRLVALEEILARSLEKFGHVRDFPLQALKALADIPAAPGESLAPLSPSVDWSDVRRWVETEVRLVAQRYLGMEDTSQ